MDVSSSSGSEAPFQDIERWRGETPHGFLMDWVGGRTATRFTGHVEMPGWAEPPYPAVNEEWWEWADLVTAVREARDRFVMMELGAGYGRWLIGAVNALRALGRDIPFHLVGVEAEPTHFAFLQDHFRNNGVDPSAHTLIQAAVNGTGEDVWFPTGHVQEWWGQSITYQDADFSPWGLTDAKTVRVPAVTLEALLAPLERVDLIDMDIQGAELEVLAAAVDAVTAKVHRLHVGTHLDTIEADLRILLGGAGWTCINDYPCQKTVLTPLGEVAFGDGVQSWLNPWLAR